MVGLPKINDFRQEIRCHNYVDRLEIQMNDFVAGNKPQPIYNVSDQENLTPK